MLEQLPAHSQAVAAVYLDYGADAAECDTNDFRVCERGMCFKSRWQFEPGMQLAIVVSCPEEGGTSKRINVEAVVANCEKSTTNCYNVITLFVDLPDESRECMRQIGRRLSNLPEISSVIEA